MTKKYLDSTGLSYFFNKIKSMFVKKSGDAVTGELKFESETNPKIRIKETSLDTTNPPSSNTYKREILFNDVNDSNIGFIQSSISSGGTKGFTIGLDNSTSTAQNQLFIGYTSNDVAAVKFSYPNETISDLFNGLNTTNTSASLPVNYGGTGSTSLTSNAILSGNGSSAINTISTANGAFYATAENGAATFGTLPVAQGGTGKTTNTANAILSGNGTSAIKNIATASGALYATAANGAATFGTLPVAQGGTGSTGISSVTTISSVITENANATVSAASYQAWGKVAMVLITFKVAASLSANATLNIGTIVSGKRPKVGAHGGYHNITASMASGGAITIRNCTTAAIGTSTTLYVSFTYLLA